MDKEIKRCSKCLLSEAAPGITFDADGVCNYCVSYEKIKYRGEAALLRILDKHRKAGAEPECIVNLSGGRDSSFTILKLAKDYGLRVLAINYRNPFTHPVARENINKTKNRLGVELVEFDLPGRLHERCLRNNLLAWCKHPSPAMIPMICIPCKIIWVKILEIAHERKISLIASGGNLFEQTSFKRELLGVSRDASLPHYFAAYLFGLVREVMRNLRYLNRDTVMPTVLGYLFSNPYAPMVRLLGRRIDRIDLFHFLPWNESEVVSRISQELNWRAPGMGIRGAPGKGIWRSPEAGTWRFDCKVGQLKELMYHQTLGLDEKADLFSKMIREGLLSRPAGISRLQIESQIDWTAIEDVLKAVKVDIQTILRSMKFPIGD